MQKGVVESLNACGIALQQLLHDTDFQPSRTGKVTGRSMQFLQGHDDGRFERMFDTLQTLPNPRVDAEQVAMVPVR